MRISFVILVMYFLISVAACYKKKIERIAPPDYEIILDTIFYDYSSLKLDHTSIHSDSTLFYPETGGGAILKVKIINNLLDSLCPIAPPFDSLFLPVSHIRSKTGTTKNQSIWSISILDNFMPIKTSCIDKGGYKEYYVIWDSLDFNTASLKIRFSSTYPNDFIEWNLDSLVSYN